MSEIFVKPIDAEDVKEFKQLLQQNAGKNGFDPDILGYPNLEIIKAQKNGLNLAFLPVQHAIVAESVAISPQASQEEAALAMRDMMQVVMFGAYKGGIREIYFLGSDEATSKMAEKRGFEKIEVPVFRLKLR